MKKSPKRLIKILILRFPQCHSVCSNISEVPFVTKITNFNAANSEIYVLGEYICDLLVLFRRGDNKQAAEEIHSFPLLKLIKDERV